MKQLLAAACAVAFLMGCQHQGQSGRMGKPGAPVERLGDEIIVCGQLFHTGAPVVTWLDPGGYDAYRVEYSSPPPPRPTTTPATRSATTSSTRPAAPAPPARPPRTGLRKVWFLRTSQLTDDEVEQVKKDG